MQNVLQILFRKADSMDNAKVGALMMLEAFVKEGYFEKEVVDGFVKDYLHGFMEATMFKIKRPLLQCLITISKHLSKEQISQKVFTIYKKFSHGQEVWGLRRLCIQVAPEMVELLDSTDVDAIKFILDFLAVSLKKPSPSLPMDQKSSEKWVRNQAMQNFGPIIHAAFLKDQANQAVLAKIQEVCDSFYDLDLLKQEANHSHIPDSFSTDDESEKIKEMWAYHLPCVLLINKSPYWQRLKPIYSEIYLEANLNIKKSLASSLLEIAKIHLDEPFMTQVLVSYTQSEAEEIRNKVVPNVLQFVKLVHPDSQLQLVQSLIIPLLSNQTGKRQSMKHSQANA